MTDLTTSAGEAQAPTTRAKGSGQSVGTPVRRVDAPLKVAGQATYAYEHDVENPWE